MLSLTPLFHQAYKKWRTTELTRDLALTRGHPEVGGHKIENFVLFPSGDRVFE